MFGPYFMFSILWPSSFAFILMGKREREMVALLQLSSWCLVTVSVLWLFLLEPWVWLCDWSIS